MRGLHTLDTTTAPPPRFTYPFCYEPHRLCREAAAVVQHYIRTNEALRRDADNGKMFGVLVVQLPQEDGGGRSAVAFLAAYSGLLAGRNDWEWFVPPVFDAQRQDGVFKMREAEISAISREIDAIDSDSDTVCLRRELAMRREEGRLAVGRYKSVMQQSKQIRDMRRLQRNIEPEVAAELTRESQFQKAELKRIRKRHAAAIARAEEALRGANERLERLRQKRRVMSEDLQRWLFGNYEMLNAEGGTRNLVDIFFDHNGALPPAAAGDCCAPKLLQYAYLHKLKPLCMAEFWWGRPPRAEIRRHLAYYPACRSRCLPILSWMMRGLDVDPNPHESAERQPLPVIYEDDDMWVVDKPAGMLSVPGKISRESAYGILKDRCEPGRGPLVVHRLDMETSGVLIFAKTAAAQKNMQRQFEQRTVVKRYVAVVSPVPENSAGIISLPIRPNVMDRPRQMVDSEGGREAITKYEVIEADGDTARIALYPLTGRTHQLRVHCAHHDGLACPIVGDALYGVPGRRLMLHCERVSLLSTSGKRLDFFSEATFK